MKSSNNNVDVNIVESSFNLHLMNNFYSNVFYKEQVKTKTTFMRSLNIEYRFKLCVSPNI